MKSLTAWIIIRNGAEMRLVRNRPNLASNEVAIEVVVNTPEPPRIVGTVTIDLPEPPPAHAKGVAIEYGDTDLEPEGETDGDG